MSERLRFHTTEKLGPKRERTPEGFLICYDVPLARIGEQVYHVTEVPPGLAPASGDWVKVLREPDQVFAPVSMASALGKPFVIYHPPEMEVNPDNWGQLACGHIQHVRRGEGEDSDVLLGDLVVTRREAIDLLDTDQMREVSMGYDAAYDRVGDEGSGLGRQRDIIFNHVALVREGRCGPRCSIGDHTSMEEPMASTRENQRKTFFANLRRAFKAGDAKAFDKEIEEEEKKTEDEEPEDEETRRHHIEVHNHMSGDRRTRDEVEKEEEEKKEKKTEDRFLRLEDAVTRIADAVTTLAKRQKAGDEEATKNEKILGELELEAPPGTSDSAIRKANDSAFMTDSYQSVIADAEIIAPGVRLPTFDAKASPADGLNVICGIRRKALDHAMLKPDLAAAVDRVMGGRTFDTKTATCGQVRQVFQAVAAVARAKNNDHTRPTFDTSRATVPGPVRSLADLQRINDEAAAKRAGKAA